MLLPLQIQLMPVLESRIALGIVEAGLKALPAFSDPEAVLALRGAIEAWDSVTTQAMVSSDATKELALVIEGLLGRVNGDLARARIFTNGLPLSRLPSSPRQFGNPRNFVNLLSPAGRQNAVATALEAGFANPAVQLQAQGSGFGGAGRAPYVPEPRSCEQWFKDPLQPFDYGAMGRYVAILSSPDQALEKARQLVEAWRQLVESAPQLLYSGQGQEQEVRVAEALTINTQVTLGLLLQQLDESQKSQWITGLVESMDGPLPPIADLYLHLLSFALDHTDTETKMRLVALAGDKVLPRSDFELFQTFTRDILNRFLAGGLNGNKPQIPLNFWLQQFLRLTAFFESPHSGIRAEAIHSFSSSPPGLLSHLKKEPAPGEEPPPLTLQEEEGILNIVAALRRALKALTPGEGAPAEEDLERARQHNASTAMEALGQWMAVVPVAARGALADELTKDYREFLADPLWVNRKMALWYLFELQKYRSPEAQDLFDHEKEALLLRSLSDTSPLAREHFLDMANIHWGTFPPDEQERLAEALRKILLDEMNWSVLRSAIAVAKSAVPDLRSRGEGGELTAAFLVAAISAIPRRLDPGSNFPQIRQAVDKVLQGLS